MAEQNASFKSKWWPWASGFLIIAVLLALWVPISNLGADTSVLREWFEQFGPLAPLVFFLLNVAQIVVAPIPGYPVQVMGGVLFGFVFGSIITVGGMVTGGVLAAWLGRRLGRPWLEKRLGAETLEHWSEVAHIDSFWTWWMILVIPFGDIPYFLAGLSRIKLSKLALAILTSRGPFTLLVVWMGDSVIDLPLTWIAVMIAVVAIVVVIGFSQAERIERWGRRYVLGRTGQLPPQESKFTPD